MLEYKVENKELKVNVAGDYVEQNLPPALFDILSGIQLTQISLKADLEQWDSSFLIILFELKKYALKHNISLLLSGVPDGAEKMLELSVAVPEKQQEVLTQEGFLDALGGWGINVFKSFRKGAAFCAESLAAFFKAFFVKPVMRSEDFLFALDEAGPKAIGIVALISFMVGLILAFVGAVQLKNFGAEVYVASLVTIGMTRIMGAIMVGVIMAGRTGASFAATLGSMKLNEEVDALQTMGVPTADFLILPRLAALVLVMPILTMLADFAGIAGGAFVGVLSLDIPYGEYLRNTLNAWSLKHFLVGVFHGFVFGFIISLCGCYFGINAGKDAGSVGVATTKAVVYSIVWMVVATGIITYIFMELKI